MKWLLLLFRPFSGNVCALEKLCHFSWGWLSCSHVYMHFGSELWAAERKKGLQNRQILKNQHPFQHDKNYTEQQLRNPIFWIYFTFILYLIHWTILHMWLHIIFY